MAEITLKRLLMGIAGAILIIAGIRGKLGAAIGALVVPSAMATE
jgi:hypothetical protein